MLDRQHAGDRLERAGGAEAVPEHRLGRGDRKLVGMVAEGGLDRPRLGGVAEWSRGAVRVDVAHLLGLDAARSESLGHHACHSTGLGVGLGDVVGIIRGAVGDNLGVDLGAAGPRRFQLLKHENPGSFADHKTVARGVERT